MRQKAELAIRVLEDRYKNKLIVNPDLSRGMVSFQANKSEPIFRWFKYREGFSRGLIEYLLDSFNATNKDILLDPFAGTGASAFIASQRGMKSYAAELLPVGCFFMQARQLFLKLGNNQILSFAKHIKKPFPWTTFDDSKGWTLNHLRITDGAFTESTERQICQYKNWVNSLPKDQAVFFDFVLFSILEEISFTRKDGQYLRWDGRAIRKRRGSFDKGKIFEFEEAILSKLQKITQDLSSTLTLELFDDVSKPTRGKVTVLEGSVFDTISKVPDEKINYVITSPPYCNRYDYTRTYALELVYLGATEEKIKELRQELLTCTVESKAKGFHGVPEEIVKAATKAIEEEPAITAIIDFLKDEINHDRLNNKGIMTMVKGYLYDSAIHLAQAFQKMAKGGKYIMVNDNVRYNGLDIPIDCLLSSIAESIGFNCEKIWVLPKGKGNSSQQMARHGRSELRKCVYVWSKT